MIFSRFVPFFSNYVTRKNSLLGQHIEFCFHVLGNSHGSMPKFSSVRRSMSWKISYLSVFMPYTSRSAAPGFLWTQKHEGSQAAIFFKHLFLPWSVWKEIPDSKEITRSLRSEFRNLDVCMFWWSLKRSRGHVQREQGLRNQANLSWTQLCRLLTLWP